MTLKVNEVLLNIAGQGQVTIQWGDGSSETITATDTPTPYTHAYSTLDRYLIEISGPGTVKQVAVQSTPKSRLEEIRSFGDIGLEQFNHEIRQPNSTDVLEENHLSVVPETIPTTLKRIDGLFAHSTNPPVSKTFTWDWEHIESMQSFLYNAKNFEFVWRDVGLPNLILMSFFAKRAQNGKIYFDNVKLRNGASACTVDQFLQNSTDCKMIALRSILNIHGPTNFISGSRNIELNYYDVTFPTLQVATSMFAGAYNTKITLDKISYPLANVAYNMFRQDGSEYTKSNDAGYGAHLIIRNLSMPVVTSFDYAFAGWTNAELDIDTAMIATLDSATGLFAFATDCTVNAPFMKFKNNLTPENFIEIVSHATDSEFKFTFMEIGQNSLLREMFVNNHRCKFELSRLKIRDYGGLQNAFLGSSGCEIVANDADIGAYVNLNGVFSNMSSNTTIRADNWVLAGQNRLNGAFSYITQQSDVMAQNWIFNGPVMLTQLCAGVQPYVSTYAGEKRGGPTFTLNNWMFNGDVATTMNGSPSIPSDGILKGSDNATVIANDWTFNGAVQIALGESVRSMSIAMSNWTFNHHADLTSFAENVGVGNLSVMSITFNNWQFNTAATNTADRAFKAFGKRGTTLFGDKPNEMIYLNGLNGWTPGAFDSAIDVKLDAGQDVFGLNSYTF